jgi:molecular chaperone GrpE
MAGNFKSGRGGGEQEPEVRGTADSWFAAGTATDDDEFATGAAVEPDVVDAEVVDDGTGDDDATGIISGEATGLSDLTEALAQRDEYLDSLRRLQAEFENYRKRVTKQQSDQTARAAFTLVEKLLPVLDTLDLATSHIGDAESADGRALLAASSQLRDVLNKEGLERIDPIGEDFDPNAHEAVGQLPAEEVVDVDADTDGSGAVGSDGGGASGEPVVAQVMRPGYRWRGAVVRPAMVMVRG